MIRLRSALSFVGNFLTHSKNRATRGERPEEKIDLSSQWRETRRKYRPRPILSCRWLFLLCALGLGVNAQASSSTYILQGVGHFDSLQAASTVGKAGLPPSHPYSPIVDPVFAYTEYSLAYPPPVSLAASNVWHGYSFNGWFLAYIIHEIICAPGYIWDATKGNCVKPPRCKNGVSVGKPCDAATGNEQYVVTDYQGSGTFPLRFTRTYNSQIRGNGRMGYNWISNYGDPTAINSLFRYAQTVPNFVAITRPNGENISFKLLNGVWTPNADITDALTQTTNGWVLTQRDGTVETYDDTVITSPNGTVVGNSTGRLLSITNRAGLTHTLSRYPVTGFLSTVTDPFGHRLTFTYDTKGRLSTMTDPQGGVTAYAYDDTNNLGNLSAVTYPDLKVKRYVYNEPDYVTPWTTSRHALTGIFDENNNRHASLTYDMSNRVIINQLADVGFGGPQQKFVLDYDSYPNRTIVTDASGNREALNFSPNLGANNLISKTNLTDNKTLTQTFDPNNNLTCRADEEGRVTTYTYNSSNQKLTETIGQSGTCTAPTPTPATRTTSYAYLSSSLDLPTLTQSVSVAGGSNSRRVSIAYDTNRNPTTLTQSGFTPSGAAVSRSVSMTYNAFGQVTSIDGPRSDVSDVTTLSYNVCTTGGGCGQLRSVTNALGQITSYNSYDAHGRLLSMTDPNGLVTTYTYDPRGRVASLTQTAAGGGSRLTSYRYDGVGNVTSTSLPTGLVLTYTYDAAHYLRRVLDSLGNYIDYGYDLKGNRTQTYTYDAFGTLVRSVDLAFDARNHVSQLNTGGSITRQVWDAVGNLTSVVNPNTVASAGSAATSNGYDALNRLFSSVDLLAGVTQYSYDPSDRVKSVQAPNGSLTQYQYDDLGNLLQEVSPDRGTVRYAYDAAGNLIQQTDARGVVVGYAYDALNRITRIDYPGTNEDVTYTYDSATGCALGVGRVCTVLDASGSTGYSYDAFGNVLSEVRSELGVSYSTRYTYDAGNRVTTITYPDGRVVNTPRDALGRITAVSTAVNGAAVTVSANRTYRPDGLLLGQRVGNGIDEVRRYNTQGQLTYQSVGTADTRLYGYDANGNVTSLQSLPQVGSYGYDAVDRLRLDQRTTTGTASSSFTYDANGNRLSENTGAYAYLANSNRLTTTPAGAITLDAAGNTTSDGTRTYTYNQAGQLSQVNGAGYSYNAKRQRSRKVVGSSGTVYHYDLTGNLIAETDTAGTTRRSYVWADSQPLAQIEPDNALPGEIILDNSQASFTGSWPIATTLPGYYGANYQRNTRGSGADRATWAVNVPSTGTYQVYVRHVAGSTHASNAPFTVTYSGGTRTVPVNQRTQGGQWVLLGSFGFSQGSAGGITLTDNANGVVIADGVRLIAATGGSSEVIRYVHGDHLNTPRLATNQQGQKVWGWEGSAFGDTQPTGTVTINLRFPGQYYDSESGLHYNWNRYYDPKLGRYVTSDPIGLAGGLNTFSYVFGNPLRWIDPLGLFCTFDFAKHYYTGGGSTIDLGAVGLLGAFQNSASVQGSVSGFKQKVSSTAKAKASSLCKDCKDKGTKSTSFNLSDRDVTNVTGEPCLFAVGHSTFFRNAGCGVTANCDNKTFSFGCSLGFSISDWFRDPIDIGIEIGGTPYRITAGWSESYSGSGSF